MINEPLEGEGKVAPIKRRVPWKRIVIAGVSVLMLAGLAYANLRPAKKDDAPRRSYHARVAARDFVRADPVPEIIEPEVVAEVVEPEEQTYETQEPIIQTVIKYRDPPPPPTIHKGRSRAINVASSAPVGFPQETAQGGIQQQTGFPQASGEASDGVTRGYATELQNTDRLLIQGTNIPCILNNAINTQLAGNVSCTVVRDIWSADNSRLLVAKGSTANGDYQIETTSSAVTRIGVQWGRIRTTDNMVAYLGSSATDRQGASGIPANSVNYHFWERFGAAFAVSLVDGALRNIGANDSGADVVVNSATGVSSDIASQILAASINMPTTRSVLPGELIIIHMQRDIEFEPLS